MSNLGLFIPTYGKSSAASKDAPAGAPKNTTSTSGRLLPSKAIQQEVRRSSCSKRSLLPSLVFNGNIEYIQTFEAADKAGLAIESARPGVLGFDIEWQVTFVAGEVPRRTATLQLCAPDHPAGAAGAAAAGPAASSPAEAARRLSPVWGTAFIFHLCHMRACPPADASSDPSQKKQGAEEGASVAGDGVAGVLPESLVRVLSDPGVLLAGVGIGGDVCRLEREYEQLRRCGVQGVVDLSEIAKRKVAPDRRKRGMWSLADLCSEMLQLDLDKPGGVRTGSWEKRPLSVDQLFYAAADAYVGLRLWQVMQTMPDKALQRSEPPEDRGTRVADLPRNPASTAGPDTAALGNAAGAPGAAAGGGNGGVAPSAFGGKDSRNTAPVAPDKRSRLSASKLETHRLWHEDGLSVEAVAELRCNKTSTVLGYLADCIEAGLPYDWTSLGIDSTVELEIARTLLAVTATGGRHDNTTPAAPATAAAAIIPSDVHTTGTMASGSSDTVTASPEGTGVGGYSTSASRHPATERETLAAAAAAAREEMSGQIGGAVEETADDARAAGRWESVGLKQIKELVPRSEYWQIRAVLARFKSGWRGYGSSCD